MKIGVISNLYPPYHIGGYELGCKEIADGLRRRGHEIEILTSNYRFNDEIEESKIHRLLWADFGSKNNLDYNESINSSAYRKKNRDTLNKFLNEFKPDAIYLWNLQGFHPDLV